MMTIYLMRWFTLLQWIILVTDAGRGTTQIEISLLLPFTGDSITNNNITNQLEISQTTTVAAVMAINHINMNMTNVLPITSTLHDYISIILHLNDTTTESAGALQSSLYQSQQSNILATIVGTSSTSTCIPASFVGSNFDLPLMSMSCTTPLLSDKLVHPSFLRILPSDDAQAAVLASLVVLFGWEHICIVKTDDIYGTYVSRSLQTSLTQTTTISTVKVTLVSTIALNDPASTLTTQLNQTLVDIQASGTRIVILCMDGDAAIELLTAAEGHNILTGDWVWLGTDAVMNAIQTATNANLMNKLNGFIGVVPLVDTTAAPYQRFVDVWQQQNVSDYLSLLPDLPSDIFAQPPRYFHPALTYDIILAYGLASKQLIDQGTPVTRESILTRLRQSDFLFDGITRTNISFDSNGNAAPAYSVMNLQTINSTVSLQTLTQVRLNGSFSDQLLNTPMGSKILASIQFHNGSAIPSDRDVSLFTTIDFLITREITYRHLPVDSSGTVCAFLFTDFTLTNSTTAPITKNCTGGFSRRLAYFQSVRATSSNVLAVDVGSAYYPSTYFALDQGVTVARWMSEMEYDVMALSSLDVALGASVLAQYLSLLQPACSVSDVGTPPKTSGACMIATTFAYPSGSVLSASILLPYVVKLVGGHKVGFVTIQKSDFATSTFSNGEFTLVPDQYATLQSTINHLRQALLCRTIVLLAVSFLPPSKPDLILVLNAVSGINVVLLYWSDIESTLNSYTLSDQDQNVVQVIRVNTANSDLMHAKITFENLSGQPIIAQTQVNPIVLPNGSPEVLSVEIEEANAVVMTNLTLNQPIATATNTVYGLGGALTTSLVNSTDSFIPVGVDGCRVTQCPIGSLLTDIMLTFCSTCTIAHINSGTIRASLFSGPVSRASILAVTPFAPKLSTYEMKGSDFLAVLKWSISKAGSGGFHQWSGVRFAYTIDRGIAATTLVDRIVLTYVEVMVGGVYQPIQSAVTYKVVATDFIVGGGDGYSMIQSFGRNINNYALILMDWCVLWLQKGKLSSYTTQTQAQLKPCWNQTYTLVQDPSSTSTLVWPDPDCRIISGAEGSGVQLCPALQTVVTTIAYANTSMINTTISSCQCISSYERSSVNSHTCQHCADNFVKSYPGDHPCVCDSTHYYLPTFLQGQPFQCVDPTGYSEYPPAADTGGPCKICPPCMDCLQWDEFSANLTNYAPTPESFDQWSAAWSISPGWWWDGRSNIIYKCPTLSSRPDATNGCKGTDTNILPCHTGSEGPLCTQCISGYSATSHHRCAECPSYGQSVALFILSLIGVILFIVFVVYSSFLPKSQSSTTNKILVRHLQTAAFIGAFRISDGDIIHGLTSAVGITNNTGAKALAYDCVFQWNMIDLMRISSVLLLILWLVTITAMISREIRKRRNPTNDDGKIFKVVEAKSFLCGCCSRSNTQQNDSADGPQKPQIKIWSWEQVCLPVCTVIILFLYPSLVLESVRFLVPCLELNGESLMANDTSISCHSSDYIQTWWIALLRLLFIGFGTPIIMLVRLRAYRRSLLRASDSRDRESRSFFLRYRFLIEGYTDAAWFWEVVNMSRHVVFVLCVAYLTQDDVSQPYVAVWVLTLALLLNMFYHPFRTVQANESRMKEKQTTAMENAAESKDPNSHDISESNGYLNGHGKDQTSSAPKFDRKRSIVSEMRQNLSPVDGLPQSSLNLNHLESVSIVILITTIIFIALSHADVVRGSSTSTSSSINSFTTTNSIKGYGLQQSYDDSVVTTSSPSNDTMSGYAVTLLALVVIMHLCFILFIFFFGFPHLRSIEYWRARTMFLIQLIRPTVGNKQKSEPLELTAMGDPHTNGTIEILSDSSSERQPVTRPLPSPSLTDNEFFSRDQFHQTQTALESNETNSTTLPTIHVHMPPTLISSPSSTSSRPRPIRSQARFSSQSLSNLFGTTAEEDSTTPPNLLNQTQINHPSLHVINDTTSDVKDQPVKSARDSSSSPPPILTSNGTISTPSRLATRFGFNHSNTHSSSSNPDSSHTLVAGAGSTEVVANIPSPTTAKLFPSLSSLLAHHRSKTMQITHPTSLKETPTIAIPSSTSPPPLPQYPNELGPQPGSVLPGASI